MHGTTGSGLLAFLLACNILCLSGADAAAVGMPAVRMEDAWSEACEEDLELCFAVTCEQTKGIWTSAAKGKLVLQETQGRLGVLFFLPRRSAGAEIGVWQGVFSRMLLEVAKPTRLFLVDPWRWQEPNHDEFQGLATGKARVVDRHQGSADGIDGQSDLDNLYAQVQQKFLDDERVKILRLPSDLMNHVVPNRSLDWVYIDGNHVFEPVIRDLYTSFRALKIGGVMLGDDGYHLPVKAALVHFLTGNASACVRMLGGCGDQFAVQKTCDEISDRPSEVFPPGTSYKRILSTVRDLTRRYEGSSLPDHDAILQVIDSARAENGARKGAVETAHSNQKEGDMQRSKWTEWERTIL